LYSSEIIYQYFPNLSSLQKKQIDVLYELYSFWNQKINVISRKDIENLYLKHVLHSMGIAKVFQFNAGTSILDAGTGGGFPGIPLAILFPKVQFNLVDSIGKKIMVVNNISKELQLSNVTANQMRLEQIEEHYQFVVYRAVTALNILIKWLGENISEISTHKMSNGIICLKGGDLREELSKIKREYKIFELSDYFEEGYFEEKRIIYIPVIR